MRKIYLYKTGLLFYGLGMIVFGIIILAQGQFILSVATLFGGVVLVAHGVHLLINIFFKDRNKQVKPSSFIAATLNITGGIIMLTLPGIPINVLLMLFTLYIFLNGITKVIDYIVMLKSGIQGRIPSLIAALFFFTFGTITAFISDMGIFSLIVVAGNYLILYGACQVNDFIFQVIPQRTKRAIKRKIRISTPVFIATFMPLRFLRELNEYFASDEFEKENQSGGKGYKECKNDDYIPEIEVLIHVSNNGVGRVGHCDLVINGEVLSYGNYDFKTASFMRLYGEGVFFTAEKKRYIRFSVTHDKKTIFCYGLRLSPEQIELVKAEIKKLKSDTYVWKPPFQLIYEKDNDAVMSPDIDYCSKLWNGTRSDFYKFHKGLFKNYFVLSTNCVLLVDSILGKAGTDIVKINGIITPGTYFDFLQRQFFIPDSMVVSRTIFNKENTLDFQTDNDFDYKDIIH